MPFGPYICPYSISVVCSLKNNGADVTLFNNFVHLCHSTSEFMMKRSPYLGYKMGFFSFQNNAKNLDPSYKMDLDLSDC